MVTPDLVREPLRPVNIAWRQPPICADLAVILYGEPVIAD
jgi:hypothetical protein